MNFNSDEPCYVISVAAKMIGVHARSLRYYERTGLVEPSRSQGNIRLYSPADIERLRQIKTLIDDLGVNLAGVEVVMRLAERVAQMERQIQEMEAEIERLKQAGL
jgi:MerR family transcriptional regulator/heat shock protein HspR